MSFEAALVSFLHPSPANAHQTVLADPVLKIHSVQVFADEPTALTTLKVKAQEFLQNTHGELYVGVLNNPADILTQKMGSYSLIISSDDVTVWFTGEKTVAGWVTSSTTPASFALGRFSLIPAENVMTELKSYANALERQGADAEDEKLALESSVRALRTRVLITEQESLAVRASLTETELRSEEYRKSALTHAQECKRLRVELESSRKNASAELQKEKGVKDKEIQSLREEAAYAVHNQQTPRKPAAADNSAQDAIAVCFASLASFDRKQLKNRQQRDVLLTQKPMKTPPVIITGSKPRRRGNFGVEYGEV